MSKLFSETECLAIVGCSSGRIVLSPSLVAKTDTGSSLAALLVSGQAGGTPHLADFSYRLMGQFSAPMGFWSSGCGVGHGVMHDTPTIAWERAA